MNLEERKIRKYYTAQVDESDCGVAALSMIFKYYQSYYSLATLRKYTKTTLAGTSALGIVNAAEHFGLKTLSVSANRALIEAGQYPTPFIAHVILENGLQHYIVVFKKYHNNLIIGDPDISEHIKTTPVSAFLKIWTGVCIFFETSSAYRPEREKHVGISRYISMLKQHRILIVEGLIASAGITGISIVSSLFLKMIVDRLIPNKDVALLAIISFGLIIVYLIQAILTYLQGITVARLSQRLLKEISFKYIAHLLAVPMNFFATRRVGEILSRFNDARNVISTLSTALFSLLVNSWSLLLIGIVLISQSPLLFSITLFVIPMYIAVVYLFSKRFFQLNRASMESSAQLNSTLIENLEGVLTIKSTQSETKRMEATHKDFQQMLDSTYLYLRAERAQQASKLLISAMLELFVLWIGTILVINGQISIGTLLSYNALLIYFTQPLEELVNLQPQLQTAKVASDRLGEVFAVPVEDAGKLLKPFEASKSIRIHCSSLTFRYGFDRPSLDRIQLDIPAGSKVLITGESGSGKSTLVKLIAGILDFSDASGELLIDDLSIANISGSELRKYIQYIPQEPFMFNGTIEQNLTLGLNADVSTSQIKEACKLASIWDDINTMPQGINTLLTERGAGLSTGQKQRITIARALLCRSKLFIFDESTSSLDALTEQKVIKNLLDSQHATIIFVAHRLRVAKLADNIIVMRQGKIIQTGTFSELTQHTGYFQNLYGVSDDFHAMK